MFDPLWNVVALALLFGPADPPEASYPPELMQALRRQCERLEITYPECAESWVEGHGYYYAHAAVLQMRADVSNLKDAPRLYECYRWPPRSVCLDAKHFNEVHRQWVDGQLGFFLHRVEELRADREETMFLWHVWDALEGATHVEMGPSYRRRWMMRYKELVGDERFYSGELLPSIPVWRCRVVKP